MAARLEHFVQPVYPPIAKQARITGTVVLHCIVGKDGSVKELQYISGPPLLMRAAMDAVRQWRYQPTRLNGASVEVDTTISVIFTLGDEPTHPVDYSQEPFIYEQVRGKMRYENDGTGMREAIARLRVQTPAGLAKAGQLIFNYNAANERIEIRSVRVTKPDGSVVTAGPSAVQDLSAPVAREAPMYTDARQKHVTVPGIAVGDIVEYDVITTTFEPLLRGQFWQTWRFASDAICLDEQFDLNVPRDRSLNLKSSPGLEPSVHDEGERRVYHWATSTLQYPGPGDLMKNFKFDIKALLEGVRPPSPRQVMFSTFQTWGEVGRWYSQLESDRRVLTPGIRAQADEIVRGQATELEKLQALYEWVSRNVRYVSLSFGVGRYQPHAAAEVLQNRYGDCKDKTALLEALLEAEGFHGLPVLANSMADIDPEIPTPQQFDHVFTFVSAAGHDYWLDPTIGVGPFGYLLPQLRGKNALVASANAASSLRMTPQDLPAPVLYKLDVQGSLEAGGRLDAKLGFDTRGDLEVLLRLGSMQLSPGQLSALVQRAAAAAAKGKGDFSFSDFKTGDPTDIRNPFHLEVRFESTIPNVHREDTSPQAIARELRSAQLDELVGLLLPGAQSKPESAAKSEQQAVKLQGPKEYSLNLVFTLPQAKNVPPVKPIHIAISRDFAEYSEDVAWEDQEFHAKWHLNLRVPEIPANKSKEYAAFVQDVTASLGGMMQKPESASQPSDSLEMYQAGLAAFNKRDYKTAQREFEGAVEKNPAFGDAWNDLGRTYLGLGLLDKAAEALHKAIEINPNQKFAYNNLGRVLWRQQKYDEAIKAFQKQIEINPMDRFSHGNLGQLYLEIEKYDLAAKELETASAITPNNAQIQVQLGRAYLELNQPDKARQSFDQASELSPSAVTWNNIAYYMSLKKLDLDRAENYARSAISSTSALLRNVSLDHLSTTDVAEATSITSYWDTLGWIKFQQGDLQQAENYVKSSWTAREVSEVGDHLGQIYEKEGRTADAIHQYALALAASHPWPATSQRLAALLSHHQKADDLLSAAHAELAARRTVKFPNPRNETGNAEFWVLFVSGEKAPDVRFISGDENLRAFGEAIRTVRFPAMFPDATETRLLRRGILSCSQLTRKCTFVLIPAEDVHSID